MRVGMAVVNPQEGTFINLPEAVPQYSTTNSRRRIFVFEKTHLDDYSSTLQTSLTS